MSENDAVRLAARLTDRDRQIALDCYEHRVLTTEQLRRLHFAGERTARARLKRLYELRVLDRFRLLLPRGQGTSPHHWILDTGGAYIVAAMLDLDRAELRWAHHTAATVADSATLAHIVATNDFATRLAEEARHAGGALRKWHGERTTRHLLDGIVIPDAYLVLERPGQPALHVLLELDRGTETHERLLEKSRGYAEAIPHSPLAGHDPLILLAVPSTRRAKAATATLAARPQPITVAVWTPDRGSPLTVIQRATGPRPDQAWRHVDSHGPIAWGRSLGHSETMPTNERQHDHP